MVKINLMPKKSWKAKILKGINIVAQVTLIIQMSSLGVFFIPKVNEVQACSWITPPCSTDPVNDESPSAIDLVGTAGNPAAQYAWDNNWVKFRERVDGNPEGSGGSGKFKQYAWVVLFQLDNDEYYDYLLSINGVAEKVQLWQNTKDKRPLTWNPIVNDPAEKLIWEKDTDDYAKIYKPHRSSNDYWVEWEIKKSELSKLGITENTKIYFATATDGNNFNKDHLDCYEPVPFCGDGIVNQDSEQCDGQDGTPEHYTCTDQCTLEYIPFCGDGTKDAGEECDDGNNEDGDGCSANCTTELTSIHGYKFNDLNNNENWDAGEPALPGWEICLLLYLDDNTSVERCEFTDSNGYYEFNNVASGSYQLYEKQQSGWEQTFPAKDEDGNRDYNFTIDGFTILSDKNFGNHQIEKPKITLIKEVINDNGGTAKASDWTLKAEGPSTLEGAGGASGYVNAGTYTLSESGGPDGYTASGWSCDGGELNGNQLTLSLGDNVTCTITNDDLPASITVYKYIDADGSLDTTDDQTPKQGWTFQLWQGDSLLEEGVSGIDGSYTFANLGPGTYTVKEVFNIDKYTALTGTEYTLTLVSGQNEEVVFSNFEYGSISGYKFNDLNGNGVWDEGEPTLSDWEICLNGETCTTTDKNGYYEFTGLIAGTYTISETMQDGWKQTLAPDEINITSGVSSQNNNFGNQKLAYPDLSVTKDDGKTTAKPGDILTYTIVYSNYASQYICTSDSYNCSDFESQEDAQLVYEYCLSETGTDIHRLDADNDGIACENLPHSKDSRGPAPDVTVTDVLPDYVTYISDNSGVKPSVSGNTYSWHMPGLNIGESNSFEVKVKINDSMPSGTTTLENIVTVKTSVYEPNTSNNSDNDLTDVNVGLPVLNIEKTVDLTYANPGNVATYTITVSNTGNETAYNVVLTDTLPDGFTFNLEGTKTKTWNLGDLLPGESTTINYEVAVGKDVKAGFYDNLAEAKADNHGKVSDSATLEVRIPSILGEEAKPILTIEKTVDHDFANPNSLVNYTVTITNIGEATAYNVVLTDTLPDGFTFTFNGLNSRRWDLGDILPGGKKVINYEVMVGSEVKAGTYENLATTSADNHPAINAKVSLEIRKGVVLGLATAGMECYQLILALIIFLFAAGGIQTYRLIKRPEVRIK